jgi:hypothetical protein
MFNCKLNTVELDYHCGTGSVFCDVNVYGKRIMPRPQYVEKRRIHMQIYGGVPLNLVRGSPNYS